MERRRFIQASAAAALMAALPDGGARTAQAAAEKVTLAERGQAKVAILTQPGATETERYAAEELARWLKELTGATFEMREAAPGSGGGAPENALVVGQGPLASRLAPDVDPAQLGGEEWVLRTTGGNCLLLMGGRPRGTLYAVYRFLQEHAGIRWWTPWAVHVPKRPTFAVGDLRETKKPAFESRDPFWYSAFNADWAARNLSNSQSASLTEKHGGSILYKGFVHTFYPLVPPDKHFATHPEWYSLIGGERKVQGGQLCTSNPELRDFITEQVRTWLKETPEARIVSISQNDWYGACQCPACKAIDEREGTPCGSVLEMVNYVARKLGPEFPNVAFDTLAYQYTRAAPRTLRPEPNVIVRLCSIECDFSRPLEDPKSKVNTAFARDIRDWSRVSQRLYIWDYTTNFAHYALPHPNWFSLGPNLRFFHRHGVRGVFEQGAYQSHGGEMAEMRAWVLAQLLRDPYQDDRKLIREFLEGYYGRAAAKPIGEYLKLMHRAVGDWRLTCFSSPGAPFLSFETLVKAERLWQAAGRAAAKDPELLWRVQQGHLPVRYAFLVRWPALRRECLRAKAEWPLPLSRRAVADEWRAIATGLGPEGWQPMTHVNESRLTPDAFVARYAVDEPDPVPPVLPKRGERPGLPADIPDIFTVAASVVDVQDDKAVIAQEGVWGEMLGDPVASDGLAVRMPTNHHEWAFQLPLSRAPEKVRRGRWRVYAVVRVESGGAAGSNGVAFTAGVYDPGASVSRGQISVRSNDAGTGYRSYLLGTVDTNAEQFVWVAPATGSGAKAIWVDRVVFVPAGDA